MIDQAAIFKSLADLIPQLKAAKNLRETVNRDSLESDRVRWQIDEIEHDYEVAKVRFMETHKARFDAEFAVFDAKMTRQGITNNLAWFENAFCKQHMHLDIEPEPHNGGGVVYLLPELTLDALEPEPESEGGGTSIELDAAPRPMPTPSPGGENSGQAGKAKKRRGPRPF